MPHLPITGKGKGHRHVDLADVDRLLETVASPTEQRDRLHQYAISDDNTAGQYAAAEENVINQMGQRLDDGES